MRRIIFLKAALSLIAVVALFMTGSTSATAQCPACADWWVEYNYIWPPCDVANSVRVDVDWFNGSTSSVSSNIDGHIIYPTPLPISPAKAVRVNGFNIVIGAPPVKIPFVCTASLPNMCLEVEARCNPCLEVKIKLVPC
jgi:hypothetical protein